MAKPRVTFKATPHEGGVFLSRCDGDVFLAGLMVEWDRLGEVLAMLALLAQSTQIGEVRDGA